MFRVLIKNMDRVIYNVNFCENETCSNTVEPFTTVLIGANGTGKSFLLAEVSELFRQLYQNIFKYRALKLKYKFYEVEYSMGKNKFIITVLKNKIVEIKDSENNQIILPRANLAVSYLLNDKFYFANKKDSFDIEEHYKYLGIRQASNVAFTSSISTQVLNCLIKLMLKTKNRDILKEIFKYLKFDYKFDIQIIAKRKTLFEKNNFEKAAMNEIEKSKHRRISRIDFRDDAISKIGLMSISWT